MREPLPRLLLEHDRADPTTRTAKRLAASTRASRRQQRTAATASAVFMAAAEVAPTEAKADALAAAAAAQAAATTASEAAAEEVVVAPEAPVETPPTRPRRGQQGEPRASQCRRGRSGCSCPCCCGRGLDRPLPPPSPEAMPIAGREPHPRAPSGDTYRVISLGLTSNEIVLLSPLALRATPGLRAQQRVPLGAP